MKRPGASLSEACGKGGKKVARQCANGGADSPWIGRPRSVGRLVRCHSGCRRRGGLIHEQMVGRGRRCGAVVALDRVPDFIERPLIGVGNRAIAWQIKMILHIKALRSSMRQVDDIKVNREFSAMNRVVGQWWIVGRRSCRVHGGKGLFLPGSVRLLPVASRRAAIGKPGAI